MAYKDCPQYFECTSGNCDNCESADIYNDITVEQAKARIKELIHMLGPNSIYVKSLRRLYGNID